MSTDSSELTFVRCPSCRSLVPAVSTRCRMCGATLDAAAAKPDESEEEHKKPGRVRQKTMTQAQSELMQAAGQVREEMAAETGNAFNDFEDSAASDDDGFDNPLGQYLDEDEPAESNGSTASEPVEPAPFEEPAPEPAPVVEVAPVPEPAPVNVAPPQQPIREENKPRVTVQSGGRQPGRSQGLSFGRQREERNAEGRSQNAGEQPAARRESAPVGKQDHRHQQNTHRKESSPAKQQDAHEDLSGTTGNLFGWLVSYDRKEGSAVELREGRFFVNGAQIKANDLIIADKGLSTPHALVSASSAQGFRVQDLMSDGGVFVKRKGSHNYQREEGAVKVEHGDWIKFADAEFLVALIAVTK